MSRTAAAKRNSRTSVQAPLGQVPRIRFKGFEDAWIKKTLSSYLSVSDERNRRDEFGVDDVYSVSREFGVINQIEYQGRSFAGASLLNYRIVRHGQLAYTKSPLKQTPYGIIKANKGKDGILSALYGVYSVTEGADPNFIQTFFERDDRLNNYLRPLINKGAKNTILVSDEAAIGGEVCFPDSGEQGKITNCFSFLDMLISSARIEHEKLRSVKKSMLVKMFPQGKATVPEIRFKGFRGEWKACALNEIAIRVTRKNTNHESDLPLTISAEHGLVDQRTFFNNRVAASDTGHYYLIRKGEFAYNRSSSDGYPFGSIKRLDEYEKGVLSTLYMVFSLKQDTMDSDYLAHYFDTALWHRDVALRAAEGARNHGLLNISVSDFFETGIVYPESTDEQLKIAAFFTELDRMISAAEKKVAKLKQVKASLLERMFVEEARK